MANTILHKANTRGHADHGWLNAHHSFSFAGYYNPERVHFGALRVLNDDIIDGEKGFGTHPHDNMEIITIPLVGELSHKDSMGNASTIMNGEIQVMSAGTGIQHSEFNSGKAKTNLLQIWVFPNKKNVTPRYDQQKIDVADRRNKLQTIVSPQDGGGTVWIHQDAWFNLGTFDKDAKASYTFKGKDSGVYAFVIKGSFKLDGQELNERDGLGIWNTSTLELTALSDGAEILLMEVPMNF
jgi:redox-sensitive bicupin YhaK (pirin superfamily)